MTAARAGEARETSGATTGGLLRYVRAQGGDDAVARVLALTGLPYTAEELDDQSRWWSYDTRIRLFAAATEVLGDPATMFKVGSAALHSGLAHSIVLLLRAMGTPRQVIRQLPRAVAKFSTTSTMEVLESGATSATVRFRLHEGYAHSRLDCDYAQGLLSTVPTIFDLPAAQIVHERVRVRRLTRPASTSSGGTAAAGCPVAAPASGRTDLELTALRGQLRILQSASTELVGSDDVDTVLHRIVARAAEAVLAPAYLLAVAAPAGGPPLVHSAGVPEDQVADLAAALLDGGDLGPRAVVVDVASARRSHGRLAALYGPGYGAVGDEASMLAAYAGHAAAALDLLIALEDARLEAERASALLDARPRAGRRRRRGRRSRDVVAEALPRIVGCSRSSILLWDPSAGLLRTAAASGMTDEQRPRARRSASIRPEDTPELVGMLTDPAPLFIHDATSSPVLRGLLRGIGSADVIAVPLLAGSAFMGVATAGWTAGRGADLAATATSSPGSGASGTRRPRPCRRPGCSRPSATRRPTTR